MQARETGVLIDLGNEDEAYENIRQVGTWRNSLLLTSWANPSAACFLQAAAFGLKSVVLSDTIAMDKVSTLQEFCEKASAVSSEPCPPRVILSSS